MQPWLLLWQNALFHSRRYVYVRTNLFSSTQHRLRLAAVDKVATGQDLVLYLPPPCPFPRPYAFRLQTQTVVLERWRVEWTHTNQAVTSALASYNTGGDLWFQWRTCGSRAPVRVVMPDTAVSDRMQDAPCPNLSHDETAGPNALARQPSPASAVAAELALVPAAPTAPAASAAPAAPRSDASGESEPIDVGMGVCQQDPKASGLDVLVGAVDIVGAAHMELRAKRTGPAAPQATQDAGAVETDERSAGATATACFVPSDPVGTGGGTACMPAERPACWSSSSTTQAGGDSSEHSPRTAPSEGAAGSSSEGPDEYRGENMEASACRALRTLPTAGGGTGSTALPDFFMATDAAAGSTLRSAVTADTNASTFSRRGSVDWCVSVPSESTPSWVVPATSSPHSLRPRQSRLGPTAHDTYAATVLAVAAARKGTTAAASPGFAKELNHRGGDAQTTAGKTTAGRTKKTAAAKAKTTKAAKGVKASRAVKAKAAKSKAAKTKKASVKKKGGKKRKSQNRRGPIGQSHFKGVCITPAGTWRAVIYVGRRQKYLGVFDSEFDAARAYDAAAILHFPPGQTPPLNNPDVIERQLNELSASDGKPFATAGAPELPELVPSPPGSGEDFGARRRA